MFRISKLFILSALMAAGILLPGSSVVAQSVEPSYTEQQQAWMDAISGFKTRVVELSQERDKLVSEINVMNDDRDVLLEIQDELGISEESYPELLRILQSRRFELQIDLAGLQARFDTAEEFASRQGWDDEELQKIQNSLKKLVELNKQQLERVEKLYAAKSIGEDQLQEARKKLLEAELRLAEAGQVNEPEHNTFKSEMLVISLDQAEKQAQLKKVESMLEHMVAARANILRIEAVEQKTSVLQSQLDRKKSLLGEMEAQLRTYEDALKNSLDADREDH